jgi:hypothetical protein
MLELRTHTQLTGRASDLGAGGCYIDTVTPFPVGTSLALNLTSENHHIRTKANVIYSHTGMGMGLAFTEMAANQREDLGAWLRELSGESLKERTPSEANVSYAREATAPKPTAGIKGTGVRDALQELVSLLRNRGLLTEVDAEVLREKMDK